MSHALTRRIAVRKALALLGCVLFVTFIVSAQTAPQQSRQAKTAEEYFKAGVAAQEAGKLEEALRLYAADIKLDPQSFGGFFNSGIAYTALGRFAEAVSAFEAAGALDPGP